MSNTPGWTLGKWNVICQRCGFKRTNNDVIRESRTNLLVCRDTCFEPIHPQEFIKSKADKQSVSFTRPKPTNVFVDVTYASSSTGIQENTIPVGTFDLSFLLLEDATSFLLLEDSTSQLLLS